MDDVLRAERTPYTAGAGVPPARAAWPDSTRGLGVLAVVLFHVLIWNHAAVAEGTSSLAGFWELTDVALGRLRMPVLFALSGLLAAGGLARGWHGGSARRRFAANYYLYAVWLTVYFAAFSLLHREDFPHSVNGPGAWLRQFAVPDTTLWFIFALALYPLALTGLRALKVPVGGVLALALALWVVGNYADLPGFTAKVLENFLFFAVGVHGAAHLWRWAAAGRRAAAAFAGAFLLLVALATVVPDAYVVPVVLLSSLVAVPASVTAMALCCRIPAVARAGTVVGARTLPIYLLHPLLLALVPAAAGGWATAVTSTFLGDALYPPVLTGAVVVLSLALHAVLRRIPGNVLFALPRALTPSSGRTR